MEYLDSLQLFTICMMVVFFFGTVLILINSVDKQKRTRDFLQREFEQEMAKRNVKH